MEVCDELSTVANGVVCLLEPFSRMAVKLYSERHFRMSQDGAKEYTVFASVNSTVWVPLAIWKRVVTEVVTYAHNYSNAISQVLCV